MALQKLTKSELEDFIEKMKVHRGRATELITVYIPAGYDVNAVQRQLEAEKSTAKNIKSTSTRKNVSDSLDKIVRVLKDYKFTPEKGMALFAGNISPIEGQSDIQSWEIEPPEEIRVRLYRCDKEFVLEPLESMTEISEIYALLVMDRKEATIGQLVGKNIEVLQKMTSGIPSKVRAGGQSSQRFHRITEGLTKDFYKRIANEMKNIFYENTKLKGILIGGPIPTKNEFVDGEYLPTQLSIKVIGVKDQGDTSESGLQELVNLSQDILADQEIMQEKKILERFFNSLGKDPKMTPYNFEDVKKALKFGAVDTLILSKEFDRTKSNELKGIAEQMGTKIEVVSNETDEGKQFLNLGGIGAVQRFGI
ncbi:peptide chain release factor 1 [Candidatus Pacearchaeota archaeon CG10_big_fil_rev_8_21_14_0_10_32_42]|nr:MAG: peptide chain release factor 1 [Candidatus Pacearchaeota archaeon CG10_big_fil_rev_8_21_14_0_10_32_42]